MTKYIIQVEVMAIILRLDRVMADRKISLKDLAEQVGIANINLFKISPFFVPRKE